MPKRQSFAPGHGNSLHLHPELFDGVVIHIGNKERLRRNLCGTRAHLPAGADNQAMRDLAAGHVERVVPNFDAKQLAECKLLAGIGRIKGWIKRNGVDHSRLAEHRGTQNLAVVTLSLCVQPGVHVSDSRGILITEIFLVTGRNYQAPGICPEVIFRCLKINNFDSLAPGGGIDKIILAGDGGDNAIIYRTAQADRTHPQKLVGIGGIEYVQVRRHRAQIAGCGNHHTFFCGDQRMLDADDISRASNDIFIG